MCCEDFCLLNLSAKCYIMDIEKVERRLKKIITVFDAFKEDGKISNIEKDLLLGYIRDLYELVKESDASPGPANVSELLKSESPTPVIQLPKETLPPIQEFVVETKVAEVTYEAPVVQVPEPMSEPVLTVTPSSNGSSMSSQVKTEVIEELVFEPVREAPKIEVPGDISLEMERLFIINKAVDLSDKLAMSKIEDISKAMGINERLFNLNELFGGNMELFNNTITKLNSMSSFTEARAHLITGVAKDMRWDSDQKWNKAHQFVRLISRRYQ